MINNAIFIAMPEEAEYLLKTISKNVFLIESKPFKIYKLNNNLIVITKIGLTNASSCFSYIFLKYKPINFLNIGLAGSNSKNFKLLQPLRIDEIYNSAADAVDFGYDYGQVPSEKKFFTCIYKDCFKELKSASLGSSDIFINSQEKYNFFLGKLKKTVPLFDMEAYGIAASANIFEQKINCIKVISDIIDSNLKNEKQFDKILVEGSKIIADLVLKYIK